MFLRLFNCKNTKGSTFAQRQARGPDLPCSYGI